MFAREPVTAAYMQKNLKLFAAYLGYSGSEIFPKQTEILVDRGDTGNFLNKLAFSHRNDAAEIRDKNRPPDSEPQAKQN